MGSDPIVVVRTLQNGDSPTVERFACWGLAAFRSGASCAPRGQGGPLARPARFPCSNLDDSTTSRWDPPCPLGPMQACAVGARGWGLVHAGDYRNPLCYCPPEWAVWRLGTTIPACQAAAGGPCDLPHGGCRLATRGARQADWLMAVAYLFLTTKYTKHTNVEGPTIISDKAVIPSLCPLYPRRRQTGSTCWCISCGSWFKKM